MKKPQAWVTITKDGEKTPNRIFLSTDKGVITYSPEGVSDEKENARDYITDLRSAAHGWTYHNLEAGEYKGTDKKKIDKLIEQWANESANA